MEETLHILYRIFKALGNQEKLFERKCLINTKKQSCSTSCHCSRD